MSYLDLAATLVKRLESCRLVGYPDSEGNATDGWGNTHGAKIGVEITQATADRDLATNLAEADSRLRDVVAPAAFAALHDHQKAALVSFVFNAGAEAGWTIWKDVDSANLADVPTQLRRFDHGEIGGKLVVIPGLDSRRDAEIVYWNTADVEQAAAIIAAAPVAPPSSGYTRAIPTPPVPTPAPPLAKSSVVNKIATAAAGGAAMLGSVGGQIHDIVAPHAEEAHVFASVAVGATGVVIACSIVGLMIHGHQAAARAV
jgi:lysozyme